MYWRRHVRDVVLAAAFVAVASTVVAATTPGVWAKKGDFTQINVACRQTWSCHPKQSILHGADTIVAVTPPKTTTGVCSAGGGAIDSCNICVVGPPSEPCVWELQQKK